MKLSLPEINGNQGFFKPPTLALDKHINNNLYRHVPACDPQNNLVFLLNTCIFGVVGRTLVDFLGKYEPL